MTKQYLVTGGTGFIGAAVVKRLLASGARVRVLDNNSRGALRRLGDALDDVEMIEADIRDRDAVCRAADGVDSVFHLAYVNGTEFFYTKPELVLDVGVKGMCNVLDACRLHGIGELVVASSSEVYQTPPVVPTPEEVPLIVPDVSNPRYSYGGGKIISELMTLNAGRTDFERVMIFRPHNVYGPDMGWEHVLPQLILRFNAVAAKHPNLALPVPLPIQGTGDETRAFVHIDDFTDGIMAMVNSGKHMNIYNIGTDDELSIREVVHLVADYFGRDVAIEAGDLQPGGTPRRCPDITKLRGLGYAPSRQMRAGIAEMADWYVAHAGDAPIKG